MRRTCLLPVCLCLTLSLAPAGAAVRYVNLANPSPVPPYASWASAATNIQDAIDVADDGDEIVVTNGVYQTGGRVVDGAMTNRVAVTKPLTVRSVNGAEVTVIEGYKVPGEFYGFSDDAVRCVYLRSGAMLVGFTLTNGATPSGKGGGGVLCESPSAVVSNCVLIGNSAYFGGGASRGTLDNCALNGNSAPYGGGAEYCTLNNCTLTGNLASDGGGAYGGVLNNCTLTGNSAGRGGGAYANQNVTLNNCTLIRNTANEGGGASGTDDCRLAGLNNCTLIGNLAFHSGGGVFLGILKNCTLACNSSGNAGGGVHAANLINCIVYYNVAPNGANYSSFGIDITSFNYSCTAPFPNSGVGNIGELPAFVDLASGNLRLEINSPCINAGDNASVQGNTDLDGRLRIVGSTVDMGAYESQGAGMSQFIGWLQQYGLPTDGSADDTDPDGDRLINRQEWRSGTNPTNALSVLRLLTPTPVGPDLVLRWESVSGRKYFLMRSTNLATPAPFVPLATGIMGQTGSTIYTDTNAAGRGPYFYRVGVE